MCLCKHGYARIADNKCIATDLEECGGKHDPLDLLVNVS